jgi:hypothetical protein
MINTKDQEDLLKLISNYLKSDLNCVAIGGTAMIFLGYKNATKDIDLVFKTKEDRDNFIKAIKELGYKEQTLINVYDQKRKEHKSKPRLFTRGDERFDLFVKDVFGYELNFNFFVEKIDFLGKKELIVYILSKEELILLKAITGRDRDYEDIETILVTEKLVDWDWIIDTAIKQKSKNSWILIDLEETLQRLKKITFIPSKYFNKIVQAQG